VLKDFTPLVERISIDEAFADVAGCICSARRRRSQVKFRHRVRTELGLPISIGIARTKPLEWDEFSLNRLGIPKSADI
jgi:DNA polymerase-4